MAKAFQKNSSVAYIVKKASEKSLSANTDVIKEIELDKIIENKLNKFSMNDDIEFEYLKSSIQRTGVLQPVVLKKNEDDTYSIIAGHRRVRASKAVNKKTVPSVVRKYEGQQIVAEYDGIVVQVDRNEDAGYGYYVQVSYNSIGLIWYNMSQVNVEPDEEIKAGHVLGIEDSKEDVLDLVETNLTARKLTVDDVLSSIELLETLIKNSNAKINGKVSEYIGKMLNMSGKQVERYRAIKNLIPELKEKVDNKEIGMSSVTGIASLPEEKQKAALAEIEKKEEETGKPVSREEVKEIKKDIEKVDTLIPELKEKVENKELELKAGAELSELSENEQKKAHDVIKEKEKVKKDNKPITANEVKEVKENIKNSNVENTNVPLENQIKIEPTGEFSDVRKDLKNDDNINTEPKPNNSKSNDFIHRLAELEEELRHLQEEHLNNIKFVHYIYDELSKLNVSAVDKIKSEVYAFYADGKLPDNL